MKKSNWIVFAIAAILSIVLLGLWYGLGFNHVDSPLDLVLTIIWWAIIVVMWVLINRVEKKREERQRTCYVMPGAFYNSEVGVVRMEDAVAAASAAGKPKPAGITDAMQDSLEKLEYGFEVKSMPSKSDAGVDYRYIVRSSAFKVKDAAQQAAGARAYGQRRDVEWNGEVVSMDRPNAKPVPFRNKEELAAIIG